MFHRRPERLNEHLKSVNTLEMFRRCADAPKPKDPRDLYAYEQTNMKECIRSLKELCSVSPDSERFQEIREDYEAREIFYLHLERIARSIEVLGEYAPRLYKDIQDELKKLGNDEYSDIKKAYSAVWHALGGDKPEKIRKNPFNVAAEKQEKQPEKQVVKAENGKNPRTVKKQVKKQAKKPKR